MENFVNNWHSDNEDATANENTISDEEVMEEQPEEISEENDFEEDNDFEKMEESASEENEEENEEEKEEEAMEEEVKKEKAKPKFTSLKRYDELEERVFTALENNDIETVLLMNELTLARNIEEYLSRSDMKQFKVINVAFMGDSGVIKRAGIYNSIEIEDSEEAEDIMIAEDFTDNRVLCVPRNSIFAEHFVK